MTDEVLGGLIGGGSALLATIVTFTGTALLQRQRGKREDQRAREQTVSELLTAAVMLSVAAQSFRTAWIDAWRVPSPKRITSDLNLVLAPRLDRLTRALGDVTQWRGRRTRPMVAAAHQLTDAAGELVEAIGAKEPVYRRARLKFESALEHFREAVGKRGA